MDQFFRQAGHFCLILVFAAGGYAASLASFSSIERMRQLERVPRSSVAAALPGEINLRGRVEIAEKRLAAPKTGAICVYYYYKLEREERDSDGNRHWRTVRTEEREVPFQLYDGTGRIMVRPNLDRVRFAGETTTRREGNLRHTEHRIDVGKETFVFGYAKPAGRGGELEVLFIEDGDYTPIISTGQEVGERARMALFSVLWCALGLLCFSMGVVFLCALLEMHQVLVYLALVALTLTMGLVYFGTTMMKRDLQAAHKHLERHRAEAGKVAEEVLQGAGMKWDGSWEGLGELGASSGADALRSTAGERLKRVRIDLARSVSRYNRQRNAFPEKLFAGAWGVPREPEIKLPAGDFKRAVEMEAGFVPAKIGQVPATVTAVAAIIAALLLAKLGFRLAKVKRYIENIPTTPAKGVAYGLAEVAGEVVQAPRGKVLKAPLSWAECVYYSYIEQEYVQHGKNASWRTIHQSQEFARFAIQDESGLILVDPEGSEMITSRTTHRKQGKRRMTERRLDLGVQAYALGTAVIEPVEMDKLVLSRGDGEMPFIVSDKPEKEILFRKSRGGLLALNLSLNAVVLCALMLLGSRGSFAATDYLLAALAASAYLGVLAIIFVANDLFFLLERVKRNWSNIDVSLKKRADLIPRLEAVAKGSMSHERELQTSLAAMRQAYRGGALLHPGMVEAFLKQEADVVGKFLGLTEKYPDLKSEQQTAYLMKALIEVENEVGFMRDGYNGAVKAYNQRVMTLPDSLFAKWMKLPVEAIFLRGEKHIRHVPKLDFGPKEPAPGASEGEGGTPPAPDGPGSPIQSPSQGQSPDASPAFPTSEGPGPDGGDLKTNAIQLKGLSLRKKKDSEIVGVSSDEGGPKTAAFQWPSARSAGTTGAFSWPKQNAPGSEAFVWGKKKPSPEEGGSPKPPEGSGQA